MAKVCPECGSTLFIKWDSQIIARKSHKRYRCKKCGRVFVHPRWTGKKKDASKQPLNGDTEVVDVPDADE